MKREESRLRETMKSLAAKARAEALEAAAPPGANFQA
jgi:hypothetical protein